MHTLCRYFYDCHVNLDLFDVSRVASQGISLSCLNYSREMEDICGQVRLSCLRGGVLEKKAPQLERD